MEKVNKIFNDVEYNKLIEDINELETQRVYCHHDMVHFLDVARIARIICSEEKIECDLSCVYAAALLHDIGRGQQYRTGIRHEEASFMLAKDILIRAGYNCEETENILLAIKEHGNETVKDMKNLAGVLYRADKLSRKCFYCGATDTCHKDVNKRNMEIRY